MSDFQYVAWFRDHTKWPDDQGYEWPACFVVAAVDGPAAQEWGDRLAFEYGRRRRGCEFLRSYLDLDLWAGASVPRVAAGVVPVDEVIGW